MASKKKDDFVPLVELKLSPKQRGHIDELGTMLGELSHQARPHKTALKKIEKSRKKINEEFQRATADFETRRLKGDNWKSYWRDGNEFISAERLLEHGVPLSVIEACKDRKPGTRVVVGVEDDGEE